MKVERLCENAKEAFHKNDFQQALMFYDEAVAAIVDGNHPELTAKIDGDLFEYIITGIAKTDLSTAKQYAQQALSLQMRCLATLANAGYFDSKEEYVDLIASLAIRMGSILAGIGFLDDAEECFNAAISVYPETGIITEDYPWAQECMGNFYTKYRNNPGAGLEWQYQAFQSTVSLLGLDSDKSKEAFKNICISYCFGHIFYTIVGGIDDYEQSESIPIYSYEQTIGLIDSWENIRNGIINRYGLDVYEGLIAENSDSLFGYDNVLFGTSAYDALIKSLASIHYKRIEDYEKWCVDMLDGISLPEDKVSYTQSLIDKLKNNGYINLATSLYSVLKGYLIKDGRDDLVNEISFEQALLLYSYGQYNQAWAFVCDRLDTLDDPEYVSESTILYIRQLVLISNICCNFRKDFSLAEYVLRCAVQIAEDKQVDLRLLSLLYSNLSSVLFLQKKPIESRDAILQSIEYKKSWAAENNWLDLFENDVLWPASLYGRLAHCLVDLRDYSEAESLFKRCLEYYNKFDPKSQDYTWLYNGLIMLYEQLHQNNEQLYYSRLAMEDLLHRYMSSAQRMTKIQRTDYWYSMNYGLTDIYSQFAIQNKSFSGLAYDAALVEKGFLLRMDGVVKNNILGSDDSSLISAYEQFKEAELRGQDSKKLLEDRVMYLYSKHPEFSESISQYHWQDVQSHLNNHDIAIEFTTCCSDGKNVSYAALALRKDWEGPELFVLGSDKDFTDVLKAGSKAYRNNDELYKLIWKALEPALNGIKNIYFSPHGAISQINIEVLENEKGKRINKLYNIYRISSTGTLCEPDLLKNSYSLSATLFGGLNYDTSTTDLLAASRSYNKSVETAPVFDSTISDLTRKGWNYLPGTEKEVSEIGRILDSRKYERISFTQSKGTEEAFKSMSGHSSAILHIATHGFYLSEKDAERNNPSLLYREDNDIHSYPLKRCGLILSGGQHAWLGEDLPRGIEDGILTGEEIAGMNLSGTDLVVLSACQTALGDIARDGVYGLQRAFKIAGAGTIIMSLWEVNDAATELMMTKFYTALASGKTKRDSFDTAIAAVKKEFEGPEYWAAFIMLD